jgi:hypothetical protein
MMIEKSDDMEPSGICNRKKTFRFLLAVLALAAVFLPPRAWAASAGAAADVSSCSTDTLPIQIMTPEYGKPVTNPTKKSGILRKSQTPGSGSPMTNSAEIPDALPHFRAFVTAITEHVNSRLAEDKLCIHGASGSMESMLMSGKFDEWSTRSWFQFVHWPLFMSRDYFVPMMDSLGGRSPCRVSSPWVDLVVERKPVPLIRGTVYWNERQLLADQAVLAGANNVPPGMAMPSKLSELHHFLDEYSKTEGHPRQPAAKPIEARVPPDFLWLFHRSAGGEQFGMSVGWAMREAREKGAEGYMKLVISLIDRCFASYDSGKLYRGFSYTSILDVADPVLLEQYRIDMPVYRGH